MSGASFRLKSAGLIVLVALVTFLFDFLSKQWALAHLEQGVLVKFVPYVFGMTLVTNTGTAFGMWRAVPGVGMLLPPIICSAIVYFIIKREWRGMPLVPLERVGYGLVLGGASGNMIDRFMHGRVTDFVYFDFWKTFPVFNVADALIDVGVALVILNVLLAKDEHAKDAQQ